MKTENKAAMKRFENPQDAERWCRAQGNASIGLIPTMGALHVGHMTLVERSVRENEFTCVSVFVNPLQFGQANDFDHYPRDWEGDCRRLEAAGCDMVFTGHLPEFFPGQLDESGGLPAEKLADPGPAAVSCEGEFRVGHFEGVATIVRRLFEIVRPARGYFGQKDFQQCLVVAKVAKDLGYTEVVACETDREESGLARSSRNLRLSADEKLEAEVLSRALRAAKSAWQEGERDARKLSALMFGVFAETNIKPEYAAVRDPRQWTGDEPAGLLEQAVALVAAPVGPVRLIDNMVLSADDAR